MVRTHGGNNERLVPFRNVLPLPRCLFPRGQPNGGRGSFSPGCRFRNSRHLADNAVETSQEIAPISTRSSIVRALRITWTAFCGFAAGLLVSLWVRSYRWCESVHRDLNEGRDSVEFKLDSGVLAFIRLQYCNGSDDGGDWEYRQTAPSQEAPCYRWTMGGAATFVTVPVAHLVIFVACLATTPWIRWSRRFTLRTQLIAITLIAVVLGTIIVLSH